MPDGTVSGQSWTNDELSVLEPQTLSRLIEAEDRLRFTPGDRSLDALRSRWKVDSDNDFNTHDDTNQLSRTGSALIDADCTGSGHPV